MLIQRFNQYLLQLFILLALVACSSGSSDDTPTPDQVAGESAKLSLSVQLSNGQSLDNIKVGEPVVLRARLTLPNNLPIANQELSFSANEGTLSHAARLTDKDGYAQVTLNSDGLTPGVISVTAQTTYQSEEISFVGKFELQSAPDPQQTLPTIAVEFNKDGQSANRIKAGENARLRATLKDHNNDPIIDTIVNFNAEIGTLSAQSALTNAQGIAEVTLTGDANELGASLATVTATINQQTVTQSLAYEVTGSDIVEDLQLKLGYLDDQGQFQPGIKSNLTNSNSQSTIAAGASFGLDIWVFDQNNKIYTSPLTINFTSSCVSQDNATLDTGISTNQGKASATFEDIKCATALGNTDTIVATATVNSATLTATHTVNIQPESLGSIEFVSATPSSIVLQGSGGQGKQESAIVTFRARGELGNPLSQQNVSFSLNTDVGGMTLVSNEGRTNAQGLVSAKLISGTVPTAVRVTATVTLGNNTITTQSDALSVNTGLPEQNAMVLALSVANPEAANIITDVQVTAYLTDTFNNPVPDGTTVNFTAEDGLIEPTCNTTNGSCNVNWRSTSHPDNHRVTILATALGHETFVDVNGNNIFDNSDGQASTNSRASSGLARSNISSGFSDLSEAWLDSNENGVRNSDERFLDFDNDQVFDGPDGRFNGPQCQGSLCASRSANTLHVRRAAVVITSSSRAHYSIYRGTGTSSSNRIVSNHLSVSGLAGVQTIARGSSLSLRLQISDTASQTLANGTTITLTTEQADLSGPTEITVGNNSGSSVTLTGGEDFIVTVINNLDASADPTNDELTVLITSPSGQVTSASVQFRLQ